MGCLAVLLAMPALAAVPPVAEVLIADRVDEAMGYLQGRVQSAPGDAEAYALLMRGHYMLQQWDEAIAAGVKATSLAPSNSDYHLWLARSYGEKADRANWVSAVSLAKKSRAEFERAVALNGNSFEARTDLAEFYIQAPSILGGGKDKARAQADLLEKIGRPGNAHWVRAKIAESDKDYTTAERELRTAIQTSGGDPDLWIALASFLSHRGRINEVEAAVGEAQRSAARFQRPGVLLDCAQILYGNNRNLEGAAAMLHSYISGPVHAETAPVFRAHVLLGKLFEKAGNRQAAIGEYRAALALAANYEPARSALKKLQ
jgi:tetratricopeptide (TPR) repeat protein